MYGWEPPFAKAATDIRAKESKAVAATFAVRSVFEGLIHTKFLATVAGGLSVIHRKTVLIAPDICHSYPPRPLLFGQLIDTTSCRYGDQHLLHPRAGLRLADRGEF